MLFALHSPYAGYGVIAVTQCWNTSHGSSSTLTSSSSVMSERTAFLIRCSKGEAATIRNEAKLERRAINNYVLNIVERTLEIEESLSAIPRSRRALYFGPTHPSGGRTAILIRCSTDEAARIRAAAKRSGTTISDYVLHVLRRAWTAKKMTAKKLTLDPPIPVFQRRASGRS
jgi:uncharacterized protein (DUF1778 family)